jgi:hypothetical protein
MKDIDTGDNGLAGRRRMLKLLGPGLLLGLAALAGRPATAAVPPTVTLYKNPACGCCGIWAKYMRARGYKVKVLTREDMEPIKLRAGVPDDLATCHTAFIEDYVVEGHVPLPAIEKMLRERPRILGIAVPGMPAGSPGMPTVNKEPFQVFAFDAEGEQTPYMSF